MQTAPTADSVSPSSGSGTAQQFAWTASSPSGYNNLSEMYALFNTSVSGLNACYIRYNRTSNLLYLADNSAAYWMGGFVPGTSGTAGNSQCSIAASGSSVNGSGNQLTVTVSVTFQAYSGGAQKNYLIAYDQAGLNSGWQQVGTWTNPLPNFTLATAQDTYSMVTGSATPAYTLTVTPINGFSGPVGFNITPFYGCGNATFNPPSVAGPPWTTTLTMPCNEPFTNTYVTTVQAYGGGMSRTLPLYLRVTATQQYSLTTAVSGSGGGTILPASDWYNSGTLVTITATPDPGYQFTGFTGDLSGTTTPQNLTMNGPKSVTANFSTTLNNSACIETNRPEYVFPGQRFTAVIRIDNTGTSTWSAAGSYALGSSNPNDNLTWGLNRVALAGSVPPGQQATFTFDATAPAAPSSYSFNWRMVQEGVGFFGQECQRLRPVSVQSLTSSVPPITASKLEVNLGPVPIDRYNDRNCRPGQTCMQDPPPEQAKQEADKKSLVTCDHGFTIRQCFQNALRGYRVQNVSGVRFMFGICGGTESTALAGCRRYSNPSEEGTGIAVREQWVSNLQALFTDIRSSLNPNMDNMAYVTPTPSLHGFGGDAGTYYRKPDGFCYTFPDFGIAEDPLRPGARPHTPIEWWPASPYAVVAAEDPQHPEFCPHGEGLTGGGPHMLDRNRSYDDPDAQSPRNNYNFVGWSNLFEVFRRVVVAVGSTPGLTLREFNLTNEFLLSRYPVQARLIYDNHRNLDVFTAVQDLVANAGFGFDPKLVTFSVTQAADSTIAEFDCSSVYGDSARVLPMSALYAGLRGGMVGNPAGYTDQGNLWCQGGYEAMTDVIGARDVLPTIADMHATPCLLEGGSGYCYPFQDVTTAKNEAIKTFNAAADLLQSYCEGGWREEKIPELCNAKFMLGEVAAKKDPPVRNIREDGLESNCDGSATNGPEGAARGYNESRLAPRSAGTVMRPWTDNMNPPGDGVVCYEFPHNLRRTFAPQP